MTGPQNSRKIDEQRRGGNISTYTNPARIGLARRIDSLEESPPSAVAKGRMTFFVGFRVRCRQISIGVDISFWSELIRIRPMDFLVSVYTPR